MAEEIKNATNEDVIEALKQRFSDFGIPLDPTQDIGFGVKADFCDGLRVLFPKGAGHDVFRMEIFDFEHHLKLIDMQMESGDYYVYPRKFHIDFGVKITKNGEESTFRMNLSDETVVIDIPVATLGDNIAWFSGVEAFQKKHKCKICVIMPEYTRALFEKRYPEMNFITREDLKKSNPYAMYRLAVFPEDSEQFYAPVDFRQCGLHEYAAYILGISPDEAHEPPRIVMDESADKPDAPYVCIATHASGMCKTWVTANGWGKVIKFLNDAGYRVIDIDLREVDGGGIYFQHIPRSAEDFTGPLSLPKRAAQISGADFFIGLGSGLSWLAWCCHKPVVLISGFSMPCNEFFTPYRVINMNVCHGCYADMRIPFKTANFTRCPRHEGTERHFECTRGISAEMVIDAIKRIPEYQERIKQKGA